MSKHMSQQNWFHIAETRRLENDELKREIERLQDELENKADDFIAAVPGIQAQRNTYRKKIKVLIKEVTRFLSVTQHLREGLEKDTAHQFDELSEEPNPGEKFILDIVHTSEIMTEKEFEKQIQTLKRQLDNGQLDIRTALRQITMEAERIGVLIFIQGILSEMKTPPSSPHVMCYVLLKLLQFRGEITIADLQTIDLDWLRENITQNRGRDYAEIAGGINHAWQYRQTKGSKREYGDSVGVSESVVKRWVSWLDNFDKEANTISDEDKERGDFIAKGINEAFSEDKD